MKTYKYIGLIIAVLLLSLIITLMTINDLVVLCKLEPVDANNLLAVQNAILFIVVKSIIYSYITYFLSLELYSEVHIKGVRNRVDRISKKVKQTAGDWPDMDAAPVKHFVVTEPDINNLNFEPVVKSVKEYMEKMPTKNSSNELTYNDEMGLWMETLPKFMLKNWLTLYEYKSAIQLGDVVPKGIKDLLDAGYRV